MSQRFALTKDSLEKLLFLLDEDRERAGHKYETLRCGLIRFFEWRGCALPESHADEAIDRVARKINQGEEIRNVYHYVVGVARFLFKEILKEREQQRAAFRLLLAEQAAPASREDDARLECIRRCLRLLPAESHQLIIAYYQDENPGRIEGRKKLADQMGISSNTLRMRIQRVRASLEECVTDCITRGPNPA